jgi:hypothetical protein
MRGLDPRIHDESAARNVFMNLLNRLMDCRVKPGNDRGGVSVTAPVACATQGKIFVGKLILLPSGRIYAAGVLLM